jgi:uncharacterized phage protein (TIGR01671 family)
MRPIKFRAWRKALGYMIYNVQNAYDTRPSQNIVDSRGVEIDYDEDCFGDFIENPCYELMQFTGLRDKKGQEIYEGDILQWNWVSPFEEIPSTTEYHEVFWKDGAFCTRQCADDVDCTLEEIADQAVVIGNIYENPELLKESK